MLTKRVRLRTLLIGGGITLFFLVLVGRVFFLQVIQGDFWHDKAVKQWSASKILRSERGAITDRNGKELAVDSPAYSVVVEPNIINQRGTADDVVKILHDKLGVSEDKLRDMVSRTYDKDSESGAYKKGDPSVWVEVRPQGWKIDGDLKAEIEAAIASVRKEKDLSDTADIGIVFDDQIKRFYPQHTLAANVLGFVDNDGNAKYGIESQFDELLKGVDGKIAYQRDAKGVELPEGNSEVVAPKDGTSIQLTIDSTIQFYAEQAAKKAFDEYKPKSASIIVADPNTMDILAMVNMPTFDPNSYSQYADPENDPYRALAVSGMYEPGSTFKIVTLSAAIQEGKFNPNDFYQSGAIKVGNRTVHDVSRSWGTISYLDGVKHSSNVAFVKIGMEMVGTKTLAEYIKNFGFGEKTGIELPGELSGTMSVTENSPLIDQAAITFGHNVNVTPIQQIVAISAVANGGHLLTPHIVKSESNPQTGEVITKNEVHKVRDVITPETAKAVSGYLEQVVSDQVIGTGRNAYIPGYRVAGKTGTAEKTGTVSVDGSIYDKSRSAVSFIGYAPADDPKVAIFVMLDEPNVEKASGGKHAAPIAKEILSQTLEYMGVAKKFSDTEIQSETENAETGDTLLKVTAPNLLKMNLEDAKSKLLDEGIAYEQIGAGTTVLEQYPSANSSMYAGQKIYMLTENKDEMNIPDLTGLSLRDAVDILALLNVSISTKGSGFVSEQRLTQDAEGNRVVVLTLKSAKTTVTGTEDAEFEDLSTGGEAVAEESVEESAETETNDPVIDGGTVVPADPAPESDAAPLN
ncbi:penicillin-binding transpeptidase domain-containing protein [Saccharibacillus sacchari]|uniref:Penicillin-binding transpeptidase domain-containing protein n=1 Tax=Saccharibacillus sacchari TaxID=456493 RepID=A0ACC6PBF1_9BACL